MHFCRFRYKKLLIFFIPILLWACSTKKNTNTTRLYHSVNTQYNIYFNANESYKEALKAKEQAHQDTLSQILEIYPISPAKTTAINDYSDSYESDSRSESSGNLLQSARNGLNSLQNGFGSGSSQSSGGSGSFSRSIDKTTKAIKLHSIKARPERDPSKKRDPQYQVWLKQQEFNPFLKNAWLLLGKSEYQDGDYLQSASTFAYIIRLYKSDPEVVAEARLWMAKANIAMGWYYEAEDIFNQIRLAGGIPEDLKHEYNKIYADFLIKQKEYAKAIPFLEEAINKEGGGLQKTRMRYLLGQLYKYEGNREKAYKAFDGVHGLSTPYLYSFNARIQQASFVDDTNKREILSLLNKMLKDHKNKDYLDQVYYAIGNIYLNDQDTVKAIDNYRKSIKESTRNGYDKALSDIALGNIYFVQRKYVEAQPIYSDALSLLSKKNENYPLVALRSEVLDELVVYAKAVHLQDSLQTLARMPEAERLAVVDKIIKDLKQKEKEDINQANREARMAERDQNMAVGDPLFESQSPNIPTGPVVTGGESSFYFYNPQTVTQGKAAFQRKWGVRKLEDDWRRRNKQTMSFDSDYDSVDEPGNDTIQTKTPEVKEEGAVDDVYSPEFYLQQIPLTPEAIDASNVIIEDAFFNMGKIYKDRLEDYNLAIDAFNTDLRRFPNTLNKEEIYYQLFLIYLRLGNREMTELYRSYILREFPQSSYAGALIDADYASNMLNMHQIEDQMYEQTYESYLNGQVNVVRENYATMKQRYPLSSLMPKFKFLDALTYAQTNNPEEFKSGLKELIADYPKSDVTPLATELLKGIIGGKQLSSDTSPFRGMIWDIRFGGDSIDSTIGVDFVANADSEYMLLLVFKPATVDKNQLIYEVANYNFSNFVYQTFDLGFSTANSLDILQVRGFRDLQDIISYIDLAFAKNSLMSHLSPSIIPIPISVDNYIALMNGKTLNEYFLFFEKNYSKEMITLIRYWNEQRNRTAEETPKAEKLKDQNSGSESVEIKEPSKVVNEKPKLEPVPADTTKSVTPEFIPLSPLLPEPEVIKRDSVNSGFGFGDVMSDSQIDKADKVINKTVDIISNPVDGLKDLFKKSEDTGKAKTKEEKQAEKAAAKLKKEQEKKLKDEEKAKLKLLDEAEKMRQDSIKNIEKQRVDAEKAIEQAKIDEQKASKEAKEDALKQRQQELKDKENARKEELKRKEEERKERLKQKENERKERLKQREQELKEKERQAKKKG